VGGGAGQLCKVSQDEEGTYIIDRDGPSFRYILAYLRYGSSESLTLPTEPVARSMLANEAECVRPSHFLADVVCGESYTRELHLVAGCNGASPGMRQ